MAKKRIGPGNTEGRRLLRGVLKSASQVAVSNAIGSAQQNVSLWARGKSRPGDVARAKLERLYGIPVGAWRTDAERAALADVLSAAAE